MLTFVVGVTFEDNSFIENQVFVFPNEFVLIKQMMYVFKYY